MVSRYISIPIESLRLDTIIEFDIFLRQNGNAVLYREGNLPFGEYEKKRLIQSNVKEVLINRPDKKKYFLYLEKNLDKIAADKTISFAKKAELLYETSKEVVIEVFKNPNTPNNIKRAINVVSSTFGFILSDKSTLNYLLKVVAYDYSVYTHSINVAIYSVALGKRLNIFNQEAILELGWGAILHDIGITKVKKNIIEKNGILTDEEFDYVKKHPEYGRAILGPTSMIPKKSYLPVLEHQEKGNGSGYPKGLLLKDISEFGRITAICDVFDALTTNKSYKPALKTYDAIKLMIGLKDHFDKNIFKHFIPLISDK